MTLQLGIIEGFYGRPWGWPDRAQAVSFLRPHGYAFYLYAPKADPHLRRQWRDPYPDTWLRAMAEFAFHCRSVDVRVGVGLSPYGLHEDLGVDGRQALRDQVAELNGLGLDDLGVLFDDMRGDVAGLAEKQAAIVEIAAETFAGSRIIVCPSYYTDDPVLDRVFGTRPKGYLSALGKLLDARIEVFWTGEEVCSREISPSHVERVAEQIGRQPFLWDNYPVNDGQRMSQYLHLRAFTGRSHHLESRVAAHGINPALQPTLSLIPALTLAAVYERKEDYAYGAEFRKAADAVLGTDLGRLVWEDLLVLQDVGLDRLGDKADYLRARYDTVDHPGAREIIDWLNGSYRITDEIVRTQ